MGDCLYIISPAYNEAANISQFLSDWYPVIEEYGNADSRLVVINDGSKDETYSILQKSIARYPKLVALDKQNQGHGPTLIYGYRYAINQGADYVYQTDSDGQTNPKEFESFWQLRKQYDGIFGYRKIRGDGISRKLVEKVLTTLLYMIFGVHLKDANAPFRLFTASTLSKYLKRLPADYNLPNVMLTTFYAYYNERMVFQEISFKPRQGGKNSINLKKIFKIGFDAIHDFKKFKDQMG